MKMIIYFLFFEFLVCCMFLMFNCEVVNVVVIMDKYCVIRVKGLKELLFFVIYNCVIF